MEQLLCLFAITIIALVVFFYLLNTAHKTTAPATNITGKANHLPVYISLADKPHSIIRGMEKFAAEVRRTETAGDKWRWAPMIIFLVGLGLIGTDALLVLFGYMSFVFIVGGIMLWLAAVVMARALRKSDSHDFSPRYKDIKQILHTLRDDLRPDTTFTGHVDLTGALLPTKVARSTQDSQNRTTEHFRDEWLSLKAKLYDGNVLRVSAIQKSKKRKSYWKRSRISGKMKSKPEKYKGSAQFLKVRIAVNPEAYKIVSTPKFGQGVNVGKYTVAQLNTDGGIIDILATSPFDEVESEHILGFLQSAYSLLQRKAA